MGEAPEDFDVECENLRDLVDRIDRPLREEIYASVERLVNNPDWSRCRVAFHKSLAKLEGLFDA